MCGKDGENKEYMQNFVCKTSWRSALGEMKRQDEKLKMAFKDRM